MPGYSFFYHLTGVLKKEKAAQATLSFLMKGTVKNTQRFKYPGSCLFKQGKNNKKDGCFSVGGDWDFL